MTMSSPAETPSPVVTTAQAVFASWVRVAASRPRKKLSDRSAKHYSGTWFNWVQWLAPTRTWELATPSDVTQYLNKITPSAKNRLKGLNHPIGAASDVTKHRYWRVLRDIYTLAVLTQQCTQNPCFDAQEIPRTEAMASMILPAWALKQMESGIHHARAKRECNAWRQIRDDALLLLLLHTAAKTGEMVTLRADQVWPVHSERSGAHLVIHIDGVRAVQDRHIPIRDPKVIGVLKLWLQTRAEFETAPKELFFGAKTKIVDGKKQCLPLSKKSVFLLVAGAIREHLPPDAFEGALAHVGAETIRNSVLARWLEEGVEQEEVMLRAGVAETRAVVRLDRKNMST